MKELKAGPLFSPLVGVIFPVLEEKELRLKLSKDKLGKLKEEYVRFRIFPFATGAWMRWCLLTTEERKAAAGGPLLDLAIWLAIGFVLGGIIYFCMVRRWCDKCWGAHWTWKCPSEDESENGGGVQLVLILCAILVVTMAFLGWRLVGWGNVRTLAKMLHGDSGESGEMLCVVSPFLKHRCQMKLLESMEKDNKPPVIFDANKIVANKTDFEADFVRILALDDIVKGLRTEDEQ